MTQDDDEMERGRCPVGSMLLKMVVRRDAGTTPARPRAGVAVRLVEVWAGDDGVAETVCPEAMEIVDTARNGVAMTQVLFRVHRTNGSTGYMLAHVRDAVDADGWEVWGARHTADRDILEGALAASRIAGLGEDAE